MEKKNLSGRLTMPVQTGIDKEMKELIKRWGADAVRNSDGTDLPDSVKELELDVYATVCLIRFDNEWAKANQDKIQQKYLLSNAVVARGQAVEINLLDGIFDQQFAVDTLHDPKEWWEVIDRSTGEVVNTLDWDFDSEGGIVSIKAIPWHKYTVAFLAYQIWEPVSILNYISNNWEGEHLMPIDPRHPETQKRIVEYITDWLAKNPKVAVVRLTSLFYFFNKILYKGTTRRFYDWTGYADTVSPRAIMEFEKEYGYRPRPEDFVTAGSYNSPANNPTKAYLDWIEFGHKFVCGLGKQIVEIIHQSGKRASLFFCDHWIGSEPYSPLCEAMGFDQIVGPVGSGTDFRRMVDVPQTMVKAVRFFPYFFPSNFKNSKIGPDNESKNHWMKIRRAHLRNPADRVEYGGYIKEAMEYPKLIEHIETVCNEFRQIREASDGQRPYEAPFTVAILNAWGSLRSWMNVPFWYDKFMKEDYTECLTGMPFAIKFISFEDIKARGIDEDIGVIINAGMAETAWSGGANWADAAVASKIREWVYHGGGLVGIGDPTAHWANGALFQLSEVFGVQKETGRTTGIEPAIAKQVDGHFIKEDKIPDLDIEKSWVYPCSSDTEIIKANDGHILVSANAFGAGRAVYLANLPFNEESTRLLHRSLYWAASKEQMVCNWFSDNTSVEVAAYLNTGHVAIINNASSVEKAKVYKDNNHSIELELLPQQLVWKRVEDFS